MLAAGRDGLTPQGLWGAWSPNPLVLAMLAAAAGLYWRGLGVLRRGPVRWRQVAFVAGLLALLLALVSPLDALAEDLFSVHMIQHLLIILVAAPLLVLGEPQRVFLAGLPRPSRRHAARLLRRRLPRLTSSALAQPAVAFALLAAAMWLWHLPWPFQAALHRDSIHALEHATFLATAILFWSLVLRPGRHNAVVAAPLLLGTAAQNTLLGVLITASGGVWYPAYRLTTAQWNLTPLQDQRLAGLMMWVPPDLLLIGSAAVVFGLWLERMEPAAAPARRTTPTGQGQRRSGP